MVIISAFIGRSFIKEDETLWAEIARFLNSLSKVGFGWEDAEESQAKPISDKVKEKINRNDIFIGILTKREPTYGKPLFSLGEYRFFKNPSNWTASYWVIQESGYAIGMNKKVIFLIEDGLGIPGGLNADFEYVTIYKNNLSDTFTKLNQIIANEIGTKLKYIEGQPSGRSAEVMAPEEVVPSSEEPSTKEPAIIEERNLSWKEIFQAIEKKEFEVAEEDFNKMSEQGIFKNEVFAKTFFYKQLYYAGKSDAMQKLEELVRDNPEDVYAIDTLVNCLQLFDKEKEAIDLIENYLGMNSKYDNKLRLSIILSSVNIKLKDFDRSRTVLYPYLENEKSNTKEQNFQLYKGLGDTYKEEGQLDISCSLYENALNYEPTDLLLRFRLGYDYGEIKKHALSAYHYKIHLRTSNDSMAFNNIGVEYQELKLLGKGVNAYKRAIDLNNTLSNANLGRIYINSGIFDEAESVLTKAIESEKHHQNVDYYLNQLKESIEAEDEAESKLFDEANRSRRFMIDFAKSISTCFNRYEEINGVWEANYRELKTFRIEIELPNVIKGTHQLDYTYTKGALGVYALALTTERTETRTKETTLSGTMINRGLRCKFRINPNAKRVSTILGEIGNSDVFLGYGIISQDNLSIGFIVEKEGTYEYFTAKKSTP
jgi:tetratricopeptide (TPR) repeat protein